MRSVNLLLYILLISACAGAQTATREPEITVRNLALNTSPDVLPVDAQQHIIWSIQGRTYKLDYLQEIANRVRYGFQMYGYFQAEVERLSSTVVTETPQREIVDIALSVNQAEQYRLKDISFTGEKVFSIDGLRAQFPIADGDIFNTEKIRQGLDALRKIYSAKGYLNFTPVPNTRTDRTSQTISLIVDIDEGVQYRIGSLLLDGPEPQPGVGAKLLENWKQYEGEIYDPHILMQFLRDNAALLPAGVSLKNLVRHQDGQLHILIFRLDLPDPVDVSR